VNLCAACGLEFTGVRDFDSHRVGVHAYTFVQGLWLDPSREDGRRCLDAKEMIAAGWFLDRHGRWSHPRRKASNRRHSRPETRRTALRRPFDRRQ
jgi:hypothetical protein